MPGKIRGLFRWCKMVTKGYEGVDVTDMTYSWKDGLALCALINRFRPDLVNFYSLSPENVYENNNLAFTIAEKEFGIPRFLDPHDMATMDCPDRYSMATYLSQFYECFRDQPMYDPPSVPEGYTLRPASSAAEEAAVRYEPASENEKSSENSCASGKINSSDNSKVRKISSASSSSSSSTSKSDSCDELSKKERTREQKVEKRDADDDEDDFDSLYSESLNLLKDELKNKRKSLQKKKPDAEKIGSGEKQNKDSKETDDSVNENVKGFAEQCKLEMDFIQSNKSNSVLHAAVCAGVAAAAASAIELNANDGKTTNKDQLFEKEHIDDSREGEGGALDDEKEHIDDSREGEGGALDDEKEHIDDSREGESGALDDEKEHIDDSREGERGALDDEKEHIDDSREGEGGALDDEKEHIDDSREGEGGALDEGSECQSSIARGESKIKDLLNVEQTSYSNSKNASNNVSFEPTVHLETTSNLEPSNNTNSEMTAQEISDMLNMEFNKHNVHLHQVDLVEDKTENGQIFNKESVEDDVNEKQTCVSEVTIHMNTGKEDDSSSSSNRSSTSIEEESDKGQSISISDQEAKIKNEEYFVHSLNLESNQSYADSASLEARNEKLKDVSKVTVDTNTRKEDDSTSSSDETTSMSGENDKDQSKSISDQEPETQHEDQPIAVSNLKLQQDVPCDVDHYRHASVDEVECVNLDSLDTPPNADSAFRPLDSGFHDLDQSLPLDVKDHIRSDCHSSFDSDETHDKEAAAANEMACQLVDQIFSDLKEHPELLKEIEYEIPSLMQEVQNDLLAVEEIVENKENKDTENLSRQFSKTQISSSSSSSSSDYEGDNNNDNIVEPAKKTQEMVSDVIAVKGDNPLDDQKPSLVLAEIKIQTAKIPTAETNYELKPGVLVIEKDNKVPIQDEIEKSSQVQDISNAGRKSSTSSSNSDDSQLSDKETKNKHYLTDVNTTYDDKISAQIASSPESSSGCNEKEEFGKENEKEESRKDNGKEESREDNEKEESREDNEKEDSGKGNEKEEFGKENEKEEPKTSQKNVDKAEPKSNIALTEQHVQKEEEHPSASLMSSLSSDNEKFPKIEVSIHLPNCGNKQNEQSDKVLSSSPNVIDDKMIKLKVISGESVDTVLTCEHAANKEVDKTNSVASGSKIETVLTKDKTPKDKTLSSISSIIDEDSLKDSVELSRNCSSSSSTSSSSASSSDTDEPPPALPVCAPPALTKLNSDVQLAAQLFGKDVESAMKDEEIVKQDFCVGPRDDEESKLDVKAESKGLDIRFPSMRGKTNLPKPLTQIDVVSAPLEINLDLVQVDPVQASFPVADDDNEITSVIEEVCFPTVEASVHAEKPDTLKKDSEVEEYFARPVHSKVQLEWAKKVTEVPEQEIINTADKKQDADLHYADVDLSLLQKAAMMAKTLARKISKADESDSKVKPYEEPENGLENHSIEQAGITKNLQKEDTVIVDTVIVNTAKSDPVDDIELRKAKKRALYRQLQTSIRPSRKVLDEADNEEVDSDESASFRSKMRMWNRKSVGDPEAQKRDVGSLKRRSLNFPLFKSESSSSSSPLFEDQKHMKKLQASLPEKTKPGSVAEYVRKISMGENPSFERRCSRESDHVDVSPSEHLLKDEAFEDIRPIAVNLTESLPPRPTLNVNPSTIFSSRPISQRRSLDKVLSIRPMSIEMKPKLEVEEEENSKKETLPPTRLSRPASRVKIAVKPLDKQPTLSDEEKQIEEEKSEVKRQDSLKRKQKPRRTLSLTSPTRPEFRDTSAERVRNIWQDVTTKPPSPKLKRDNSFEVKIRPVSLQFAKDEKNEVKTKTSGSKSPSPLTSRPPTPTKSLPKVNISIKSVKNQSSPSGEDVNLDFKPRQISSKPGRRSILSLVGSSKNVDSKPNMEDKADKNKTQSEDRLEENKPTKMVEKKKDAYIIESTNTKSDESKTDGDEFLLDMETLENHIIFDNKILNVKDEQNEEVAKEDKVIVVDELNVTGHVSKEVKEEITVVENVPAQFTMPGRDSDYKKNKEDTIKICNSIFGSKMSHMSHVSKALPKDVKLSSPSASSSSSSDTDNEQEKISKITNDEQHKPAAHDNEQEPQTGDNCEQFYKEKVEETVYEETTKQQQDSPMQAENVPEVNDDGKYVSSLSHVDKDKYLNDKDNETNKVDNGSSCDVDHDKMVNLKENEQSNNSKKASDSSSSSSSSEDEIGKHRSPLMSSPSSAAEIEKPELKEGLKSIIKDLEAELSDDVKSDMKTMEKTSESKGDSSSANSADEGSEKNRKKKRVKKSKSCSPKNFSHLDSDKDSDGDRRPSPRQDKPDVIKGQASSITKGTKTDDSENQRKTSSESNDSVAPVKTMSFSYQTTRYDDDDDDGNKKISGSLSSSSTSSGTSKGKDPAKRKKRNKVKGKPKDHIVSSAPVRKISQAGSIDPALAAQKAMLLLLAERKKNIDSNMKNSSENSKEARNLLSSSSSSDESDTGNDHIDKSLGKADANDIPITMVNEKSTLLNVHDLPEMTPVIKSQNIFSKNTSEATRKFSTSSSSGDTENKKAQDFPELPQPTVESQLQSYIESSFEITDKCIGLSTSDSEDGNEQKRVVKDITSSSSDTDKDIQHKRDVNNVSSCRSDSGSEQGKIPTDFRKLSSSQSSDNEETNRKPAMPQPTTQGSLPTAQVSIDKDIEQPGTLERNKPSLKFDLSSESSDSECEKHDSKKVKPMQDDMSINDSEEVFQMITKDDRTVSSGYEQKISPDEINVVINVPISPVFNTSSSSSFSEYAAEQRTYPAIPFPSADKGKGTKNHSSSSSDSESGDDIEPSGIKHKPVESSQSDNEKSALCDSSSKSASDEQIGSCVVAIQSLAISQKGFDADVSVNLIAAMDKPGLDCVATDADILLETEVPNITGDEIEFKPNAGINRPALSVESLKMYDYDECSSLTSSDTEPESESNKKEKYHMWNNSFLLKYPSKNIDSFSISSASNSDSENTECENETNNDVEQIVNTMDETEESKIQIEAELQETSPVVGFDIFNKDKEVKTEPHGVEIDITGSVYLDTKIPQTEIVIPSETVDDTLLKTVIEDQQPFKVPLLEDAFKSGSFQSSETSDCSSSSDDECGSTSGKSALNSEDELYLNNMSEKVEYLLPDCNVITTDFHDLEVPDIDPKGSSMEIQVFVIPDVPIGADISPKVKNQFYMIPDCGDLKHVLDFSPEEDLPEVVNDPQNIQDEFSELNGVPKPKLDLDVELEGVSDVPAEPYVEPATEFDSEDELLRNVIHHMNIVNNRKRTDSTSSSSSSSKSSEKQIKLEVDAAHKTEGQNIDSDENEQSDKDSITRGKNIDTSKVGNKSHESDSSTSNDTSDNDSECKQVQAIVIEVLEPEVNTGVHCEITPMWSKEVDATLADKEFLIGREKDPSKSEVARLIQQSLEIDRKREEHRRLEAERLRDLQDQFRPRDEVLEHEHRQHLAESASNVSNTSSTSHQEETVNLDESSAEENETEEPEMSEEYQAGEATPMEAPSAADSDNSVSSPEEPQKPVVEVFELPESSGDDISPDMESQALFIKLKEAQCKNAVLEAELTRLKAKLIVLENTEGQRRQYEKKCEEMAQRLRETEKSLNNARKEINHYQDLLEGSQGQYIALEKKQKADYTALEKKYHKAKKLIKEYQQREKDFITERESLLQQQSEKDQQYNALVKSLKDRIFQLEGELSEARAVAGLPQQLLQHDQKVAELALTMTTTSSLNATPLHDSGSPLMSPLDRQSVSSESDISAAEPSEPQITPLEVGIKLESVPVTPLLDTSVNKAKGQVANNSRRPPTKQRSKSQDSDEMLEAMSPQKQDESGLETWIKHDSDTTVKKSDVKKRRAQQQAQAQPPQVPLSDVSPIEPLATPLDTETTTPFQETMPSGQLVPPPPSPPTNQKTENSESSSSTPPENRRGSDDSSSTLSQTSYDPSNPQFHGLDAEIPTPDSVSTGTATTESESSSTAAKKSKGLLPKLPFKFGSSDRDKGGITLLSSRSLNTDDGVASEGGITLISKKKLETGLDYDGSSTVSDSSSGYMVGEQDQTSYNFSDTPAGEDMPRQSGIHSQHQIQSCPIPDWGSKHICHWLMGIEMDKYADLFTEKSVSGEQLVTMDSNKLKALGITNAKDRDILKKKIKELKAALDKERKQLEKDRKMQEKEQRLREKEQKKMFKKK